MLAVCREGDQRLNLSLFDQPVTPIQKGAGTETGRPVDAGDAHSQLRASSDHAVDAECASSRSDANGVRRASGSQIPQHFVIRTITHKSGGFRELRKDAEGKVIGVTGREFRILETPTGYLREWNDGVIDAAPVAVGPIYIADGLRFKTLVEVPA